jgi:predicted kinase
MEKSPTIIVCMGAPGSGKTTWCKSNARGAVVISADSIRDGRNPSSVFNKMISDAKRNLDEGRDVIIDACSSRSRDRKPWLFVAAKKKARSKLIVFDTPMSVCAHRDSLRSNPAGMASVYAARINESMGQIGLEGWDEIVVIDYRGGNS